MIPYNPSSFNTNKTILEQILELKNWLINHPQYEVYYCNDNASLYPFMNTFSLANVPDNTNMDVGDLVVCNNAVYCTVISIDRDNGVFTAGYGVSFKGDTGAAGQQGYSLRVSSENYVDDVTAYHRNSLEPSHGTRENDTILFANGYVGIVTSLGAGATYYVTNRTVSFVGPQGPQGPEGPEGSEGPEGPEGPQGVSITNVAIDGNSHLIVTLSDGSTIDAGSVSSGGSHIVTLTTYSGTLTDEQYNTLLNDDAIIIYNSGTELMFFKEFESDTEMTFCRVNSSNYRQVYTVTKSTKAYARTTAGIRSSAVDSQTATNGQVLMANGSGGASWQNAGGTTLNHYTKKNISLDKVVNILRNAKGHIDGHISITIDGYGYVPVPVSALCVNDSNGQCILSGVAWTGAGQTNACYLLYTIVRQNSSTFDSSFMRATKIDASGTVTRLTSFSYQAEDSYIEYWNDIQLH